MHHRCNSFICKCCSLGVIQDSLFCVFARLHSFHSVVPVALVTFFALLGNLYLPGAMHQKRRDQMGGPMWSCVSVLHLQQLLGTVCVARARMQDVARRPALACTSAHVCKCADRHARASACVSTCELACARAFPNGPCEDADLPRQQNSTQLGSLNMGRSRQKRAPINTH